MAKIGKYEKQIIRKIDAGDEQIFSLKALRATFAALDQEFGLQPEITYKDFYTYFTEKNLIKAVKFKFPWRTFVRYTWRQPKNDLQIVGTIEATGYFCHYTAVNLHGFTLQNPKEIYFNVEQSPRPRGEGLSQLSIDKAFKNNPRTTKQIARYGDYSVYYLMGKNSGNLGVVAHNGIHYTDIERTMIDIVVRPNHCGGIREVLRIYQAIRESNVDVSVNRIRAYLKNLQYVYPYQQSIGYLMDIAGFQSPIIALFKEDISEYNFYLDYKIIDAVFDPKWKIFIPKDFPKSV